MNDSIKVRGEALRSVMRRVPYPVTIVTASAGDQIRGITIGSFTSLSLDPPLISFNIEQTAQMHPVLEEGSYFAVHIPGPEQSSLCDHFAIPDLEGFEQFDAIDYHLDDKGTPILNSTLAVVHCRKFRMVEAGDHSIVIGEVLDVEQEEGKQPGVLYFNRAYHQLGPRLRRRLSPGTD